MFKELFSAGFGDTLIRFAICFVANWLIVNFLYYKKSQDPKLLPQLIIINFLLLSMTIKMIIIFQWEYI